VRINAAGRGTGGEGKVAKAVIARPVEVTVLEPDIDVAADRHVHARKQLPREAALASRELMHACIAATGAEITANAPIAAEVGKRVDHPRVDTRVIAKVECG